MDINKKIKDYLEKQDISQAELAGLIGISSTSLNRSLNSDDLKISLLTKICAALKVPASKFFDGSEMYSNDEIENYKSRIKDLEFIVQQFKINRLDKFFTEALNILKYEYPNVSESVKQKVKEEITVGLESYSNIVNDLVGNLMLDLSEISKVNLKNEIDELIKKHSQE